MAAKKEPGNQPISGRYPHRYDLTLDLDPSREWYSGTVTAYYASEASNDKRIILHQRGLEIHSLMLRRGEGQGDNPGDCQDDGGWQSLSHTRDDEQEQIIMDLPDLGKGRDGGPFCIRCSFSGTLAHDNRGLYLAAYRENGDGQHGEDRHVIVSQFEESDARKAFPCFDEPFAKAFFSLTLTVPVSSIGLANGELLSSRDIGKGRKELCFKDTPPMSTYLLFIGVGDFSSMEKVEENIHFRAFTVAGRTEKAEAALCFAAESFTFLKEFTGAPYPFQKLDLVACPDFAFGAMENYSIISYRENLMLFDPEVGTAEELERIGQVSSHEVAHMWFGDLVSPRSWDYVWLNESLATYLGFLVNERLHPEWAGMDRLILNSFSPALERDSLPGTIPIEFPEGTIHEISPAVVPIIYSKAGAVMRMFHHFLGEEHFKEILHTFLIRHQYGSADTDQFLDVMESYIHRSIPEAWIRRKGFPLVSAERAGSTLHLRQEPFTSAGQAADGSDFVETSPWPIPLTYSIIGEAGERDNVKLLFDRKEMIIDLPPASTGVCVNSDRSGFYRVQYGRQELDRLGQLGCAGSLEARERFGLIDDLFALLCRGDVSLHTFLEHLVNSYPGETAFLPLAAIGRSLRLLYLLSGISRDIDRGFSPSDEKLPAVLQSTAEAILLPALENVGFSRDQEENFQSTILRGELMTALYHLDTEKVIHHLRKEALLLVQGGSVDQNIEALIIKAGAGEIVPLSFVAGQIESGTDEARRVRLSSSLPAFPEFDGMEKLFTFMEARVASRNWHILFNEVRYFSHLRSGLFDWFINKLDRVNSIHPLQGSKMMVEAIVWGGMGRGPEIMPIIEGLIKEKALPSEETAVMALDYLALYERIIASLNS